MRVARRGGLLAGLIFTPLVALTVELTPGGTTNLPGLDEAGWVSVAIVMAFLCAPGLTLLGAALAGSTGGDRVDAVVTGVAMAVGVPVAAILSTLIGTFVVIALKNGVGDATDLIGALLRAAVTAALRISPLIALGAAGWVVLVRRFGRATLPPTA
jgi:hypothetical protein